jgi:hypothetical protein
MQPANLMAKILYIQLVEITINLTLTGAFDMQLTTFLKKTLAFS